MKLPAARVAAFLRRPNEEIRAVLLYGPDAGLVSERAEAIARTVCSDLKDPFRVADLSGSVLAADPARLADEAAQMSLVGGRRVVRVREAADRLARLFGDFLRTAPGDALVVIEAGELSASSSLRRVFEAAPNAVAIGCYADTARDLAAAIGEALRAHRITASDDATQYLVEHLGNDRLVTRSELEKLALYAGEGGRVALDDARLSIGDNAAIELDDAVMAAAEGDVARTDRVLCKIFQESESPVSVIRAMLRHLHRLHALAARLAEGSTLTEVMRSAQPPIFFTQEANFRRQLALWTEGRLRAQLDRVGQAELQMKLTGLPAETLCREAMLAVAQNAHDPRQRDKPAVRE
jgi:DNA polymerase III subunit delta